MKAYVFPGQGAQFEGMAKMHLEKGEKAVRFYKMADEILGYGLSEVMTSGTAADLKETKITQPALFVHSLAAIELMEEPFDASMVGGHSLGEFSALVAAKALSFEDGLRLVQARAFAMQKACEISPSTMAAVVGMDDALVEDICQKTEGVVPANYNSPGQIVISGTNEGIDEAMAKLTEAGAKRVIKLAVGGAFHSPVMEPARQELEAAIEAVRFQAPTCPIYQNVTALPSQDPDEIKMNLIAQLTAPVKWTQTIQKMIEDGATDFVECGGNGKVLRGLIRRISREVNSESI